MEIIKMFLPILTICILANLMSICAQDVCSKVNNCKCVFSNGTGFDLSPSAGQLKFTETTNFRKRDNGSFEVAVYFYHPCQDITYTIIDPNATNNTCTVPLAICRHVNKLTPTTNMSTIFAMDPGVYDFIGSSNQTTFSADGHTLTYIHGPSRTHMQLVCADTPDRLGVISLEEPNDLMLAFYSRNACLKQLEEPGRSTGSTLCIIFFSVVLLYLVLGMCTKKFLMGATGVEVIPNLGFWSDLPNLVREGWAFALSGFKLPVRGAPATSPDPNSYDSI